MLDHINAYLAYQGKKYIKPEKAGALAPAMIELKELAQAARKEFATVSQLLAPKVAPFLPERISQWMNQAQVCRPHFWDYYRLPDDSQDDVGLAIRLYGEKDSFGISVEVSFVERKKSDSTLAKQSKVLDLPAAAPIYYFVQVDGVSSCQKATEENRLRLQQELADGQVRKVLVKYNVPCEEGKTLDELTDQLAECFALLLPYYEATKG